MKMLVRTTAVLLLLGGIAGVQMAAQGGRRPMTFADLQAMKRVSDPQISPNGKWVLFSVTDVSLEKNSKTNHLWAVPLSVGVPSVAGAVRRGEVQQTFGNGESNGRFSPDGKWVMYSSGEGGSSQVWLAPWNDATGTMDTGARRQATNLETETDGAVWAPDSKHFLFVSNVYPECQSHAAMGAARNEEEAACNARKDAEAAKNPVKALIFDSLLYRHWTAYQGAKHSHIFYADVGEGAPVAPTDLTPASVVGDHEAPTFSLGGPMGYAISPDGREVAYVVNLDKVPAASTNNDIFVLQVGAEPGTAKKVSTAAGSDDGPAYSPDGKWLAWRSQERNGFESDKFRLVVMDRSSGAIKDLMPKFENWVDEFVWTPNSQSIYFAAPDDGEESIGHVGLATAPLIHRISKDGEFGSLQVGALGQLIAVRMKVQQPAEIVIVGGDTVFQDAIAAYEKAPVYTQSYIQAHNLTHLNDALVDKLDLAPLEPFWFDGAAGTEVEGFIVKPPNFDPAKKYPVKFLMHGGPQTAWGDAWSYRWNPELFAANGYVVVMVNRRGSTGYGQKFVDEVSGDWGGKAFVDLMKGLDYAEKTFPFIDKDRECALGASYGGFMANWVLTHTDRFKCIVTHDGMYNPQSAYGTTEELWFNEWEFRPMAAVGVEQAKAAHPWDYFGASNENDPFRKWSPMLHIKDAHTPTLIIHSQKDYRLDVSEGFQMFTALQRLGVPSRMLYFPDEGHWVQKPQNSQLWNETVNDWCDRWLGMGKYKDVGPERIRWRNGR